MEQDYEYKMVGQDEHGNPLYQRVEKQSHTVETPSPSNNIRQTPPIIHKTNKMRKTRCNSSFLCSGLDDKLLTLRHEQAKEQFPTLKLLENEIVLKVIRRHVIGVIAIWAVGLLIAILIVGVWISISLGNYSHGFGFNPQQSVFGDGSVIVGLLLVMVAIFTMIFTKVYRTNSLIVTTERVVQYISNGLFDYKKQTIDLSWVEDVSYHRRGLLETLFNYGSVRLSTIGDESTYYFILTPRPDVVTSQLNDVILAIKNEMPLPGELLQ